jgi:hypothetical protein
MLRLAGKAGASIVEYDTRLRLVEAGPETLEKRTDQRNGVAVPVDNRDIGGIATRGWRPGFGVGHGLDLLGHAFRAGLVEEDIKRNLRV